MTKADKIKGYILALEQERLLSVRTLKDNDVTFTEVAGRDWMTFAIEGGAKLRAMDGKTPRFMYEPSGTNPALYKAEIMTEAVKKVVICEGELDCLLLNQCGIPAVTSTSGAQTFPEEWLGYFPRDIEIIICLDHDEAGEKGREKIKALFKEKRPDVLVSEILWSEDKPKGFDVSDAFFQGIVKEKIPKETMIEAFWNQAIPVDDIQMDEKRIVAHIRRPREEVGIEEWKDVILKNFPDLLEISETCMSVVSQLLINDIHNCTALILVDVPSSGKTICLNFFVGLQDVIYASDNFSPASLVSHAANKKKAELGSVDLLPRIRFKALVVREMAAIFSEREDTLKEKLGIFTRALDGEGLTLDSGVHGCRGYQGDYMFQFLGASTPIPFRVWKLMRAIGHRILFLGVRSGDDSIEDLINIVTDTDFKTKEQACRAATHDFIRGLWNRYPDGIDWKRKADDKKALKEIAHFSQFLSKFRGDVSVYKDKDQGTKAGASDYENTRPQIEKPKRIMTTFTNMARGHALIHGRQAVTMDDVAPIARLAIDSAQDPLPDLIRVVLRHGGKADITIVQAELHCGWEKAKREMRKLDALEVCHSNVEEEDTYGSSDPIAEQEAIFDTSGQKKWEMTLREEWMWLLEWLEEMGITPDQKN